jgi:hypothetical protein
MIPQIIVIVWIALTVGMHLEKHGKTRTSEYNFFSALFTFAIFAGLLFWGGFFDPMFK